jgi:hypothetical protein
MRSYSKNKENKNSAVGMVQVVECLPDKHKVLSSASSTAKTTTKKQNKQTRAYVYVCMHTYLKIW